MTFADDDVTTPVAEETTTPEAEAIEVAPDSEEAAPSEVAPTEEPTV